MKVWILEEGEYEDRNVTAVYSTEEKAKAAEAEVKARSKHQPTLVYEITVDQDDES